MFANLKKKIESEVGDLSRLATPRSITSDKLTPLSSRQTSISSLTEPINNNTTPTPPTNQSQKLKRHFEEKLQTQELDFAYRLNSKDDEIGKLAKQLQHLQSLLQSNTHTTQQKLIQVQEDMDSLEGFSQQENAKIKHLLLNREEELSRLRAELLTKSVEVEQLQSEVKSGCSENERLRRSLDEAVAGMKQRGDSQQQELVRECEELKTRLGLVDKYKQELDQLSKEKSEVVERLAVATRELELERGRSDKSDSELGQQNQELVRECEELKTRLGLLDKYKQELDQLSKEKSVAVERLQSTMRELERCQHQHTKEVDELTSSQSAHTEQLSKLSKEKSVVVEKLKQLEALLEKEREHLIARVREGQTTTDRLQSELDQERSHHSMEVEQLQKEVERLNASGTELESQLTRVSEENSVLKATSQSDTSGVVEEMRKELDQVREEKSVGVDKLAEVTLKLDQERSDHATAIKNLQSELDHLHTETTTTAHLKSQLTAATNANVQLQQQLQSEAERLQTTTTTLNQQLTTLKEELTTTTNHLVHERQSRLTTEHTHSLQTAQLTILTKEKSQLTSQLDELTTQLDRLTHQQSLESTLVMQSESKLREENDQLQSRLEEVMSQVDKTHTDLASSNERVSAVESELTRLDGENRELVWQCSEMQAKYDEVEEENRFLKERQQPPPLPPKPGPETTTDSYTEINFLYLRSVLFKYLTTTDPAVVKQLTRVVATLLRLSEEEAVALREASESRSGSWLLKSQ